MLWTCPSVRPSVRSSVLCHSCERVILKTNEPILLQIGTCTGKGDETVNFLGQKVKGQSYRTPKLDLETWRRHHSRLLQSSFHFVTFHSTTLNGLQSISVSHVGFRET